MKFRPGLLNSQSDVDGFQAAHGPCDLVSGNLTVTGTDIVSLQGLGELSSVTSNLFISDNPLLPNVNGLSKLQAVGGTLTLQNNTVLSHIDGLSLLQTISGSLRKRLKGRS